VCCANELLARDILGNDMGWNVVPNGLRAIQYCETCPDSVKSISDGKSRFYLCAAATNDVKAATTRRRRSIELAEIAGRGIGHLADAYICR
jgi:hypothetical protein